ncbi:MAG: substrate-binding domain-containing protein [Clostridiales bacterium]|nr:substrate-binding domain-containing protein [Clostridiales bacterium]
MDDAKARVDRLTASKKSLVRIGYASGWEIGTYISPILGKMKANFPNIRISLEACEIQELTSKFYSGQLDLILALRTSTDKIYDAESLIIATVPEIILFSDGLFQREKQTCRP